jgi:NTE family protein
MMTRIFVNHRKELAMRNERFIRRSSVVAALFVLIVFSLIVPSLWAQEPGSPGKRGPKIALVLGGGGARGAAHAGVLKVLEANRIPIDFIVGTSMGSIVGGLYAAGYSADEIDKLFNDIDWLELLSDRPSEDMLSFRNKKDFQRMSNLELGFNKGKISFPRGIISGQKLDFMLQKLMIHTMEAQSFDELPISFRAVATDAVTGKMVVFDKGSLAEAVRASMSVPGAFPPVKSGGKLLVDGYLTKNVPVEIAKEWGADIIITVDVGEPLKTEDELKSLIDIVNQMNNVLANKNVEESLKLLTEDDILIHPVLKGIGCADFVKTPEAVREGEKTALEHVAEMQRYSVSDEEYRTFLAHQRVRDRNPIMIDFVKITRAKRVNEYLIRGRMETKAGKPLNFDRLEKDLTSVYAIGDFETVGFDIKKEDGRNGLILKAREKSWGPEYLRFGLNMQSDVGGTNNYSTVLDYRHTQMNPLGGEWRVVGQLGQTSGLSTDFYQPLDYQNFYFIDPVLEYKKTLTDIYAAGTDRRTAQYRTTESGGGVDVGVNLRSYLEARVGLRSSIVNAKPEVGDESLPNFENIQKTGVLAQINFDQLNDHRFPTKGIKAETRLFLSEESFGADQEYQKLDFTFGKATTLAERHTFITMFQGGVSLENNTPFYDKFTAGGFLKLSGLGEGQLRGENMGVGDLIYMYKLVDTKGFANKVYVGGSFEAGNVWENKSDFGEDLIYGGSLFLGLDTILGPLYIGYGQAERHDGRAFVYLGKTF